MPVAVSLVTSDGMRRTPAVALIVCVMATAGCARKTDQSGVSTALNPAPSRTATVAPTSTTTKAATPGGAATKAQPTTDWPTPSDCISYNPEHLTVSFDNGAYVVTDGSHEVIKVAGQTGDTIGQQALALAQRYRKHCFIGRGNNRENHYSFVFDYWRDLSGQTPAIPGQDDNCSGYNRHNLTVEDMGGGDGWRVKDHDHVLHLFDNGNDARNGSLVLQKYGRYCQIGGGGDDNSPVVDYSLA